MLDWKYWSERALHRLFNTRFIPSIHFCVTCDHHVQPNHVKKRPEHRIVSFGWRYRKPDPRNYSIRKLIKFRKKLPSKFDLRDEGLTAPVMDQGNEGSCTGAAYYAMKAHEKVGGTYPDRGVSPRHIYNAARAMEGNLHGEGAYPEDLMKYGKETGVCTWRTWPYLAGVDKEKWPPPDKALEEAPNYKIEWYADLVQTGEDVIENIKQSLVVMKGSVYMGTAWPKSWLSPEGGILPVPHENEEIVGYHAWVIIGFVDSQSIFTAQNSWGKLWRDRGFFKFFYDTFRWFAKHGYNAFKVKDAESPEPEPPRPKPDPLNRFLRELIEWLQEKLKELESRK